jgi:hypothetical protein
MDLPFHLGLRNDQHLLGIIRQNGHTHVKLGVAYPQDSNPRQQILTNWGRDASSPRQAEAATIDMPLPRRAQAALGYQLNPALRQELASGFGPLAQSRSDVQAGLQGRVHQGQHPLLETRPEGFRPLAQGLAPSGRQRF